MKNVIIPEVEIGFISKKELEARIYKLQDLLYNTELDTCYKDPIFQSIKLWDEIKKKLFGND